MYKNFIRYYGKKQCLVYLGKNIKNYFKERTFENGKGKV